MGVGCTQVFQRTSRLSNCCSLVSPIDNFTCFGVASWLQCGFCLVIDFHTLGFNHVWNHAGCLVERQISNVPKCPAAVYMRDGYLPPRHRRPYYASICLFAWCAR